MTSLRIPFPTEHAQARGITPQHWGVLIGITFPLAKTADAILQAWDVAQMRSLDIFGGHVAIVTQSRREGQNWVDFETCWLTVKALIYLAHRTDSFAGIDEVRFGPVVTKSFTGSRRQRGGQNQIETVDVKAPEYATAKVYRFVKGQLCAFTDTVFFDEAVALSQGLPNAIWAKKPMLMLSKCAKVAALRLGFAECDYAAEEMDGQIPVPDLIPASPRESAPPAPDGIDNDAIAPERVANEDKADPSGFDAAFGPAFDASGDTVEHIDGLPAEAIEWLDRNLYTAAELGAFDQVIDAMQRTLDQRYHAVGERLIRNLALLAGDKRFGIMWSYIKGARDHGGDAFEKSMKQFDKQTENGAISREVADAAKDILTFLQIAS